MERTVSATEARVRFAEMLKRVGSGETLIVIRGGSPQAVILSLAEYRQLKAAEAQQVAWPEQLQAVRIRIAAGRLFAAPGLLFDEVANALYQYQCHAYLSEETGREALATALDLPI